MSYFPEEPNNQQIIKFLLYVLLGYIVTVILFNLGERLLK